MGISPSEPRASLSRTECSIVASHVYRTDGSTMVVYPECTGVYIGRYTGVYIPG